MTQAQFNDLVSGIKADNRIAENTLYNNSEIQRLVTSLLSKYRTISAGDYADWRNNCLAKIVAKKTYKNYDGKNYKGFLTTVIKHYFISKIRSWNSRKAKLNGTLSNKTKKQTYNTSKIGEKEKESFELPSSITPIEEIETANSESTENQFLEDDQKWNTATNENESTENQFIEDDQKWNTRPTSTENYASDCPDPFEQLSRKDGQMLLRKYALRILRRNQDRQLYTWAYIEEKTAEDIAQIINRKPQYVNVRIWQLEKRIVRIARKNGLDQNMFF